MSDVPLDAMIIVRRYRERLAEANETIVLLETRLEMIELQRLNASAQSAPAPTAIEQEEKGSTSD